MRNKLQVVALSAALVVVTGLAVLHATAAQGAPLDKGGMGACTTDAGGYCTVTHALGAVPGEIQVTGRSPIGGTWTIGQTVADRPTASTFRLRAIAASGAPIVSQPITFWWHVWSGQTSPPTTPATTTGPPTSAAPTTAPPTTAPPTTEPPTPEPPSTDPPTT